MLKRCVICGLQFEAKSNSQKVCGSDIVWNSLKAIKPCSAKCSAVLRKRTMQSRYNVDNARSLRKSTKINHYANLKYIKSLDKKYTEMWSQFGVDVWRSEFISPSIDLVEFSGNLETYVIRDKIAKQFFSQFGVNGGNYIKRKGVNIGLVSDGVLYQAIRIEQPSIKGFDCQLVDYGTRLVNRRAYSSLLDTAANIYGLDTAICCVEDHQDIDSEMKEMGFMFQFSRPGQVWWNGVEQYKKTDNISEKLQEGHLPTVRPLRKMYDTVLFHF